MVLTGLDVLIGKGFETLRGRRIGLLCNQASIARDYRHILEHLLPHHRSGFLKIQAVFGPEHGLWGHTQDNMIEWEGEPDPRTGLTIHSLYGEHRKPTPLMLEGIDLFVVDIPDVGTRYYTFIWSMALCMEACAALGIPVLVLDRPNPIGGVAVEGPTLDTTLRSFVGLYPLPIRHGLTPGEVALFVNSLLEVPVNLELECCSGWSREMYFEETELPWAMPSPNMPTPDTALVYPGQCLLEATNLSEGRGTTRPFEIFGAPYLDGWRFSEALNAVGLPGVYFRPVQFEPTFNKHAKTICEGAFVHVTAPGAFQPVLTSIAILQEAARTYPDFAWKQPPYEYEFDKLPIDILAGREWIRQAIEAAAPLGEVAERMQSEAASFMSEKLYR
jgi:uncharacterized protein YbbC (DUF1343 family)